MILSVTVPMWCQILQGNKDLFICSQITKAKVNKSLIGPKYDKKSKFNICFIQGALNQVIHLLTTHVHSAEFLKTLDSFPPSHSCSTFVPPDADFWVLLVYFKQKNSLF